MRITSVEGLRALYAEPSERVRRKQLDRLDLHCARFVGLSPYVVIATTGADGRVDASPRGGEPGFVKVDRNGDLLLPDAPGSGFRKPRSIARRCPRSAG